MLIAFEIVQLVLAERLIGTKQMARGIDPREYGPGEFLSFCWLAGLLGYWVWMLALFVQKEGRPEAVCLLLVSLVGQSLRRHLGLRWCLVILTFEGAFRIGILVMMIGVAYRSHRLWR